MLWFVWRRGSTGPQIFTLINVRLFFTSSYMFVVTWCVVSLVTVAATSCLTFTHSVSFFFFFFFFWYYCPYSIFASSTFRSLSTKYTFYGMVLLAPHANPQTGGPRYPFLSGSSPLTCLALDVLPVATLPPT